MRIDHLGFAMASRFTRPLAVLGLSAFLASCGGGGGGSSASSPQAQACSPNNPYAAQATAPTTIGSLDTEKAWLRDYMDRQYLWYSEIPAVNASGASFSNEADVYTSLSNYFEALKTPNTTASGARKDKFSFTTPTKQWQDLINGGSSQGYGIEWYVGSKNQPRSFRVAFVQPHSPAANAGIQRGDTLVQADGVPVEDTTSSGIATFNAARSATTGTHLLRFSRTSGTFDVNLTTASIALNSVDYRVLSVEGASVGYLLFNEHLRTAEQPLINAVQALKNANVTDLVLDLRYNSGGYLYLASELAYMIAGPTATANKAFENTTYNSKRSAENRSTPFYSTACLPDASSFNCTSRAALPTLNLPRVYVLSSSTTCSASEAVVNGLRGVDIDVRLIGGTTCGKPYGFRGADNCGIGYFAMEFQGNNAKGFGDFGDGLVPSTVGDAAAAVPGCTASDDLDHALGDPTEGQLAAALHLRANGSCPAAPSGVMAARAAQRPAPLGVERPQPLRESYGKLPTR